MAAAASPTTVSSHGLLPSSGDTSLALVTSHGLLPAGGTPPPPPPPPAPAGGRRFSAEGRAASRFTATGDDGETEDDA